MLEVRVDIEIFTKSLYVSNSHHRSACGEIFLLICSSIKEVYFNNFQISIDRSSGDFTASLVLQCDRVM